MAKSNWGDLQKRLLFEYTKTSISPRDWREAQGLNYSSAKRYIEIASYGANSQKGSTKRAASSQEVKKPKKAAKAEPELETTPAIVKHPYTAKTPDDFDISDQRMTFTQHVVGGKPRAEAYRLVGHSDVGRSACANASHLMRSNKVSRYIGCLRNERQTRYNTELDDVVSQLEAIIDADPNDIGQYRRANCHYYWGFGRQYQQCDAVKFEEKRLEALERKKREPPDAGGYGFDQSMDSNPECPRCNGEGRGEAFFTDTRDIEGDACYLLHGVKLGKFRMEILTVDKDSAHRELAHLILLCETNERQVQLDTERLALQNEKLRHETELMKDSGSGSAIVVRNTLPMPGR